MLFKCQVPCFRKIILKRNKIARLCGLVLLIKQILLSIWVYQPNWSKDGTKLIYKVLFETYEMFVNTIYEKEYEMSDKFSAKLKTIIECVRLV